MAPDANNNWLDHANSDFQSLIPLADRQTKFAKSIHEEQAVFGLYSMGVSTNRDEWVYDFNQSNLLAKAKFFAARYNSLIGKDNVPADPVIKWSRDLRNEFRRQNHISVDEAPLVPALYRPFTIKWNFSRLRNE